jgi:hypothetical protein
VKSQFSVVDGASWGNEMEGKPGNGSTNIVLLAALYRSEEAGELIGQLLARGKQKLRSSVAIAHVGRAATREVDVSVAL